MEFTGKNQDGIEWNKEQVDTINVIVVLSMTNKV